MIRRSKCGVSCLQETKLARLSSNKLLSFCGPHLRDFKVLDAIGSRGGIVTAWNPSLFECIEGWTGQFSVNTVLKRRVDGKLYTISNVYGPTLVTYKAAFFRELKDIGDRAKGARAILGDFNALLSQGDKNGPLSRPNDVLLYRNTVEALGFLDLPISNKVYTWSNGRPNPTLERLDRALISRQWCQIFPRSTLRALPRPRSDHTPLLLTAHSFVPSSLVFRLEAFWLRHPGALETIHRTWASAAPGSNPVQRFATKLNKVSGVLKSWSHGLSGWMARQSAMCQGWIMWLDRAEELRPLVLVEIGLRAKLKTRIDELCLQDEIKWKQRSRVQWLRVGDANTRFFHLRACERHTKNYISELGVGPTLLSEHHSMAKHLFEFFHNQLGSEGRSGTRVDFQSIYPDGLLDLTDLERAFTEEEVKRAVF